MSELRLYIRRDSLREGHDCHWILRQKDGLITASGNSLDPLPKARHCHLLLAADLVTLVPAKLPDLPQRKLQALLPATAEAYSLSEAEQLHVAWIGRDAQAQTWLACVDKAWLGQTLSRLRDKGIHADAALPESLLLPATESSWSVLWNGHGSIARLSRLHAQALDQNEPPAGLRLALSSGEAAPHRVRVYHDTAQRPIDPEQWQANLGIPVEAAGTWNWREAEWPGEFNLLQGPFQPRHGRFDLRALAKPLAWGLLALASIQTIGMTTDWGLLAREQQQLRTSMRNQAERALPAHAAIVDPAWQVAEQLKTMHAAQGEGEEGFIPLLNRIGSAWPTGASPNLRVLEYHDGGATLMFGAPTTAATPGWIESFKTALAAANLQMTARTPPNGGVELLIRENRADTAAAQPGDRHDR